MTHARRISAIGLAMTCGLFSSALAHPGHFSSAFHAHSRGEACKLADSESKLIFLFVSEPGGRGCPYLRWPTPERREMIDLLIRETVIAELDAAEHAADLEPYQPLTPPAILLLNPDGTERRRFAGDLPANIFLHELENELSTEQNLARVREALDRLGTDHFFTRERWAGALARSGRPTESLEEYAWCVDAAIRETSVAAAGRRPYVFAQLADLAQAYAPAARMLDEERTDIERMLQSERDDSKLARDLARLNHRLDQDERTLKFFDQLDADSRARHGLFDYVCLRLIEQGRYDEVLSLVRPIEAFRGEVEWVRHRGVTRPASARSGFERGTRRFAVARGAALVEALAGTGANREARELIDQILSFDSSASTREMLAEHVRRTGNDAVAAHLKIRADLKPAEQR